jgi:hypothetical protein
MYEEEAAKIKELFPDSSYYDVAVEVTKDQSGEGICVSITSDYEYVKFENVSMLVGYHRIMEILGCKDGDEEGRTQISSGCRTCQDGSRYEINLRFW